MRAVWALPAVLAACYGPSVHSGAPCGPSGLVCLADRCLPPGTNIDDASVDDAAIEDAADASTATGDAPADAPPVLGPWGTPVVLSTGISSETDPSMTFDRKTIVFMSEATDDLYIATRATATGTALTSTALTALNSTAVDKSPEISPDGSTIYFVSNRAGNYDVYRSTLSGGVWSSPTLLADLSTAGEETDVAVSPDGLIAAVIDNDTTNILSIYTRATTAQPFGPGVAHPELTVGTDIAAPTITNGGNVIYFHAGGTRDIYIATKKGNGTYTTPVLVTELNTVDRDASPFVLQDDKHMIFERTSDLYETAR